MNCVGRRPFRLLLLFVVLAVWGLTAGCPRLKGGRRPKANEVLFNKEGESVRSFGSKHTGKNLSVAVRYGQKDIPIYLGADQYAPPQTAGQLQGSLVEAFKRTGMFRRVSGVSRADSKVREGYLLEVVMNPTADFDDGSKLHGVATLGASSLLGVPLNIVFKERTELRLVYAGPRGRTPVFEDVYKFSGMAASSVYQGKKNVSVANTKIVERIIPHTVNVVSEAAWQHAAKTFPKRTLARKRRPSPSTKSSTRSSSGPRGTPFVAGAAPSPRKTPPRAAASSAGTDSTGSTEPEPEPEPEPEQFDQKFDDAEDDLIVPEE